MLKSFDMSASPIAKAIYNILVVTGECNNPEDNIAQESSIFEGSN